MKSRALEILAMAIMLISIALCYLTLDRTSPTYDEPNYLDASKQIVNSFDFRQQNTILHPPLTYWLNGLLIDWAPQESMAGELHVARVLGLIVFFLTAQVLVFFWSRTLFGPAGALLSVVLFAFCPIVMAHARLATTDMAACCTFFAATYALWFMFRHPTLVATAAAGILIGIALLAKYSTILLIPIAIFLLSAAFEARRKQTQRARKKDVIVPGNTLPKGPRPPLVPFAVALVVALTVLAAGYKFEGLFKPLSEFELQSEFFEGLAGIPGIKDIPMPVPQYYVEGIDFQKQISETGFTSFLLGEKSFSGVWYYYPVCFLLKMPVPFMILLVLGAWEFVKRKRVVHYERLFTLLPPLLFFAYLVYPNTSNAGFRYAMPAIPFLAVLAGAMLRTRGSGERPPKKKDVATRSPIVTTSGLGATLGDSPALRDIAALKIKAALAAKGARGSGESDANDSDLVGTDPVGTDDVDPDDAGGGVEPPADGEGAQDAENPAGATGWRRWWRPGLAAALCVWIVLSIVLVHPYYIAWQNELAGGSSRGFRAFAGSDFDWGQDEAAARAYWDTLADVENRFLPPFVLPLTGTLLISANELNDCLRPREVHSWLRLFEPTETIGHTWLVYSLNIDAFEQVVERNPDDLTACYALAGALLAEGRHRDCRDVLDQGLARKPDDGRLLFVEGLLESRSSNKGSAIQSLQQAVDAEPGLMEAYIPLRFMLIRAGRDRTEETVRRAMIEAEIGQSHVSGYSPDRAQLEKKAAGGTATTEELCALTVLAWCDNDLADSFRHARAALAGDEQNIQALGNLLFLTVENPAGPGSYLEALSLLARIESLIGKREARSTPILRAGGDRIVFGPILTFRPPTRAQVEARFLLQRDKPPAAKELIITVRSLINEKRLAEAQRLVYEGMKRFPENRDIRQLNYFLEQQERGI